MKVLLLACALFAAFSTSHAIWDYLSEFSPSTLFTSAISHLANTKKVIITQKPLPVEENVFLYIATREYPNLTLFKPGESLADRNISASKPLVIWSHGYIDNGLSPWMQEAGNKSLKALDCIFIAIDWHPNANLFYPLSAAITRYVGKYVANVIANLSITEGLDVTQIIAVGHSLGAHICGFMGKEINRITGMKIYKIIGMDPAGPCFWGFTINGIAPCEDRLCKTDAKIVLAIHTNKFLFGIAVDIGTGDFWLTSCGTPLFGLGRTYIQTDCLLDMFPGAVDCCNHLRSYEYMLSSFDNPVAGYKCNSLVCAYSASEKILFSGYNTDFNGTYYGSATGKSDNITSCN